MSARVKWRSEKRTILCLPLKSYELGKISEMNLTNFETDRIKVGGAKGDRTPDLNAASVALSQLSYGPIDIVLAHNMKLSD